MGTETQVQPSDAGARFERRASWLRTFIILFASFLVMIVAAALSTIHLADNFWRSTLRDEITRDLTQKAQLFAARVNTDRATKISDIAAQASHEAGARATVVDGNGKVLADSEIAIAALEKEGQRPEFAAALRGDVGVETRGRRGAFGIPILYVAVPVPGGAVRLARPLADIDIASAAARRALWMGCSVGFIAALLISALTSRVIGVQ